MLLAGVRVKEKNLIKLIGIIILTLIQFTSRFIRYFNDYCFANAMNQGIAAVYTNSNVQSLMIVLNCTGELSECSIVIPKNREFLPMSFN